MKTVKRVRWVNPRGVKHNIINIINTACLLSHFSCICFHAALWTVAHQALLFMGFSRQGYWSGLPCLPPGDLPNPGIESMFLMSPAVAGGFFTTSSTWETHN